MKVLLRKPNINGGARLGKTCRGQAWQGAARQGQYRIPR